MRTQTHWLSGVRFPRFQQEQPDSFALLILGYLHGSAINCANRDAVPHRVHDAPWRNDRRNVALSADSLAVFRCLRLLEWLEVVAR